MLVKPRLNCENCIKPVARRLGLFQAKDDYECYAEGYVKCFWGLCDLHKSDDAFFTKAHQTETKVITDQPMPQVLPYNNRTSLTNIYSKK